ncbi:hypothetical protein NpNSSI1_00007117 [Neofusicoccum parvum]|nr:hypothetical protein NpNSSI1_00007117 [Neofusicoccum parvum]
MVETKNDYSSIKVHKRASSTSSNVSQPSNGTANPASSANTTSTSSGHHHHHHHRNNNNTTALEKARAARRRAQYLPTASHAAKLAEDHCTHARSNWRAAQKAQGVARPYYRRAKPSHFCQERKRLGSGRGRRSAGRPTGWRGRRGGEMSCGRRCWG